MPETIPVRPSDLQLDEQNPRLAQPNADSGNPTSRWFKLRTSNANYCRRQRAWLPYGMNPAELRTVMPRSDDPTRYIIPEGNRRRFLADQQFTGSFTASSSITVVI
jgi:hypothetical protein